MGRPSMQAGAIALADVDFHPFNAGRDLGDLRPLTDSIRRNGLIHPIVVERRAGRFRVRAGHRRVVAARLAGRTHVPALIHTEPLADREWLVHMVEENTLRKDLSAAERVQIIRQMRRLGVGWDGIGAAFGVAPVTARAWLGAASTTQAPAGPAEAAPAPRVKRPPSTVSIRRVAEVLDDLTDRARAGALTVEDCLAALRAVLQVKTGGPTS